MSILNAPVFTLALVASPLAQTPIPPELPAWSQEADARIDGDWLVREIDRKTALLHGPHEAEITLSNGLLRRVWRVSPNAATVAFDDLRTGASLLRAVKPEATVTIDGIDLSVGGLVGQPDHAYLRREWIDDMRADPLALQLASVHTEPNPAPFAWKRARHAEDRPWPAPGRALTLEFRLPRENADALIAQSEAPKSRARDLAALTVFVHYEMYDAVPVLAKWLTVHNGSERTIRLDRFTSELLAVVEVESIVDSTTDHMLPGIEVLSDYMFGGMSAKDANHVAHWVADAEYSTQVNYRREAPMMLAIRPPVGPSVRIEPGQTFESFRAFEVVYDSTERERNGLALRRAFRTIAPWCTENPIMMHVRRADPDSVKLAIDQCAEVGFELVILTFGSGFNIENEDPQYRAGMKELADYAHRKGIELGGYSLLSSRRIGPETDVIDHDTGRPGGAKFGNAPCLGSRWGRDYFRKLYAFFEATGFDLLEHDGSYPGDFCASTSHPGHDAHEDSQWSQWRTISDFYRWCRARGVYLNVPDFYFLSGSTKIAMGYRETNWSLPRAQQIIHARQNIFDGTWQKTPSMGWMFVPLTQYHGGGAAATIEPLDEHLDDYEAHMVNNFGLGVQACYRGPRLYDTPRTKAAVKKWVEFYKRYRNILESDVLHLRRADGRDLDYLLHVNPRLARKGFLMVYNPLDHAVEKTIRVPLYYTGLTATAQVRERDGATPPWHR